MASIKHARSLLDSSRSAPMFRLDYSLPVPIFRYRRSWCGTVGIEGGRGVLLRNPGTTHIVSPPRDEEPIRWTPPTSCWWCPATPACTVIMTQHEEASTNRLHLREDLTAGPKKAFSWSFIYTAIHSGQTNCVWIQLTVASMYNLCAGMHRSL
jgi:hypothetical protein